MSITVGNAYIQKHGPSMGSQGPMIENTMSDFSETQAPVEREEDPDRSLTHAHHGHPKEHHVSLRHRKQSSDPLHGMEDKLVDEHKELWEKIKGGNATPAEIGRLHAIKGELAEIGHQRKNDAMSILGGGGGQMDRSMDKKLRKALKKLNKSADGRLDNIVLLSGMIAKAHGDQKDYPINAQDLINEAKGVQAKPGSGSEPRSQEDMRSDVDTAKPGHGSEARNTKSGPALYDTLENDMVLGDEDDDDDWDDDGGGTEGGDWEDDYDDDGDDTAQDFADDMDDYDEEADADNVDNAGPITPTVPKTPTATSTLSAKPMTPPKPFSTLQNSVQVSSASPFDKKNSFYQGPIIDKASSGPAGQPRPIGECKYCGDDHYDRYTGKFGTCPSDPHMKPNKTVNSSG